MGSDSLSGTLKLIHLPEALLSLLFLLERAGVRSSVKQAHHVTDHLRSATEPSLKGCPAHPMPPQETGQLGAHYKVQPMEAMEEVWKEVWTLMPFGSSKFHFEGF